MKKSFITGLLILLCGVAVAQTGYYDSPGGNCGSYGSPGVSYSGGQTTYSGYGYNGNVYASGTVVTTQTYGNAYEPGHGHGQGQGHGHGHGHGHGNQAGYGPAIPAHACGGYCNASYHVSQTRVYTQMHPNRRFSWRITEGLCWVPGFYQVNPYGCQVWVPGQWIWREIGRERLFGGFCH